MKKSYGAVDGRAGQQTPGISLLRCCNCWVAVPQDKYYAVEHFGKFQSILGPGLAWVGFDCCGLCYKFRAISKRVEQNECVIETKTKDNVFVTVHVAVQQMVVPEDAETAIYKLNDVGRQIDAYVADVVRAQVPLLTLDEAFERKDSISDAICDELRRHMAEYGFKIHRALVTEIKPDKEVVDSMNQINMQRRLRDAAIMAADAEKIRVVTAAEGAADAAHLQGEGIARQRAAIVKGLRESISDGTERIGSERITELLLISQYFETMRDIGASSKSQAIFIPQSPAGAISDIASQIRNGVLQSEVFQPLQQTM